MRNELNCTIGVVSPSFFLERVTQYNYAIQAISNYGFNIVFDKNCAKRHYYSTATAVSRAKELMLFFSDPEIDIIICMDGGCCALEIIRFLDFDYIKKNGKLICGFSDNTHIINSIYTKTGLETIHGVDIVFILGGVNAKVVEQSISYLNTISNPVKRKGIDVFKKNECWVPGVATGVLVGGWIDAIDNLMSVDLLPKDRNVILCFEALELEQHKIHMFLNVLLMNKGKNNIKGIVIGTLSKCDEVEFNDCIRPFREYVTRLFFDSGIVVIKTDEFGHEIENRPFVIGGVASIKAVENGDVEFKYL